MLVFVFLWHLGHTVTERITRYVILYTGLQNNSFLVQEYHTFCGSSFNLLCVTLFACSDSFYEKTVFILHCLMLIFTSGTITQENNFFPFQSLMVISLNFLIASLINSCSNLTYAVHFCLDTYFQIGYLDCSTAEQRDCMW